MSNDLTLVQDWVKIHHDQLAILLAYCDESRYPEQFRLLSDLDYAYSHKHLSDAERVITVNMAYRRFNTKANHVRACELPVCAGISYFLQHSDLALRHSQGK